MPGRLSDGTEGHDIGGTEMGESHDATAATVKETKETKETKKKNRKNKKKHSDVDHLVEERRLATQCPTPPTDPFPDFENPPTAPNPSNLHETLTEHEMDTDEVVSGHPLLRAEAPNHDGGPPLLSASPSFQTDHAVKLPPRDQEQHVGLVVVKPRAVSNTKKPSHESIRKLSASQMQALTSAPDSLPVAVVVTPQRKPSGAEYPLSASAVEDTSHPSMHEQLQDGIELSRRHNNNDTAPSNVSGDTKKNGRRTAADFQRPPPSARTLSSPPINRKPPSGALMTAPFHSRRNSFNPLPKSAPLDLNALPKSNQVAAKSAQAQPERRDPRPSPIPPTIPLPPMSLPTHLQLELAAQRPSPLYIHHSEDADIPYESSALKFERLLNALLLPPYLEQVMYFGTLACLDAWLYTFTILPMRFLNAVGVLVRWWLYLIWKEVRWVVGFVWSGLGRLWRRGRRGRTPSHDRDDGSQVSNEVRSRSRSRAGARASSSQPRQKEGTRQRNASDLHGSSGGEQSRSNLGGGLQPPKHPMPRPGHFRHRRTKSMPSSLTSYHKADLLQGAVLICSAIALSKLDASRMYHFIRAQSSMKLYVIYNILEVSSTWTIAVESL